MSAAIKCFIVAFLFVSAALADLPAEQPLQSLEGATYLLVGERTGSLRSWKFSIDDPRLIEKIPEQNRNAQDFYGTTSENYDLYFSDRLGRPDKKGAYLSIAAWAEIPPELGGGMNIAIVRLVFKDGSYIDANSIQSFESNGANAIKNSELLAIDGNPETHSTLGTTIGRKSPLRLTFGFPTRQLVKKKSAKVTLTGRVLSLREKPGFTLQTVRMPKTLSAKNQFLAVSTGDQQPAMLIALSEERSELYALRFLTNAFQVQASIQLPTASQWYPLLQGKDHHGPLVYLIERSSGTVYAYHLSSDTFTNLGNLTGERIAEPIVSLDLDGDGITELAAFSADSEAVTIWFFEQAGLRAVQKPLYAEARPAERSTLIALRAPLADLLAWCSNDDSLALLRSGELGTIELVHGGRGPTGKRCRQPLFVHDFQGIGSYDVAFLFQDSDLGVSYQNGFGYDLPQTLLNRYPGETWQQWIRGDFSGSGYQEAALFADHGRGWQLILPYGVSARSRPIGDLPTPHTTVRQRRFVGDFNGDTADDILFLIEKRGWQLATADVSAPLNGVSITLDKQETTESSEHGYYRFQNITQGRHRLDVKVASLLPTELFIWSRQPLVRLFTLIPEQENRSMPQPCLAFNPARIPLWGAPQESCSPNTAVIESDDTGGNAAKARSSLLSAVCCPLPMADLLVEKPQIEVVHRCPPNHIVTGSRSTTDRDGVHTKLLCSEIKTSRYQLGPRQPGHYWGVGLSSIYSGIAPIDKQQIPLALRHAVGRRGFNDWDTDGCIGKPWGSVLVAREAGECEQHYFSEIQFRGRKGDPPQGTAIPMVPKCNEITDVYDPEARCHH